MDKPSGFGPILVDFEGRWMNRFLKKQPNSYFSSSIQLIHLQSISNILISTNPIVVMTLYLSTSTALHSDPGVVGFSWEVPNVSCINLVVELVRACNTVETFKFEQYFY